MRITRLIVTLCLAGFVTSCAQPLAAQDAAPDSTNPPATAPATAPVAAPGKTTKLPHMTVDVANRQVRVDCVALAVEMPLEFFCVTNNGPTHESVLASAVKPSDLHLGLLMLGLEPGEPVRYSEAAGRWFPPVGPPLQMSVEFQRDGQTVRMPATRLMRHLGTQQEMPQTTWIYCGSRLMEDGTYAADITGYLISVVNFDLTVIDVPDLRSSANESLEWESNPDQMPPEGTEVTLIIEPAGAAPADAQADAQAPDADDQPINVVLIEISPDGAVTLDRVPIQIPQITAQLEKRQEEQPVTVRVSSTSATPLEHVTAVLTAVAAADVSQAFVAAADQPSETGATGHGPQADEQRMAALRERWEKAVKPNRIALRDAAQAHYEVILQLRQEQQRLIDEADKIQRLIDQLEREYQDITTPRPRAGN